MLATKMKMVINKGIYGIIQQVRMPTSQMTDTNTYTQFLFDQKQTTTIIYSETMKAYRKISNRGTPKIILASKGAIYWNGKHYATFEGCIN